MYKDSREQREEENKNLKKEKIKIYDYIEYLKRNLIEKNTCRMYKEHSDFSIQFCLNECNNKDCVGKKKINEEFAKLEDIEKEIEKNQSCIDKDIFYN